MYMYKNVLGFSSCFRDNAVSIQMYDHTRRSSLFLDIYRYNVLGRARALLTRIPGFVMIIVHNYFRLSDEGRLFLSFYLKYIYNYIHNFYLKVFTELNLFLYR